MAARFKEPSTALGLASRWRLRAARCLVLFFCCLLFGSSVRAESEESVSDPLPVLPVAEAPEQPLFSIGSPIGPFEYAPGRGLRVGNTGLNIGGFTTVEFDKEESEHGELEVDALSLLVLFEPNQYIRGFAELEIGELLAWETQRNSVDVDVQFEIERLYFDLRVGDPLNLRMGKFQTPIGRWNLVPAEPFVWTAEEPAFVEVMFDEHTTGGSLLGSTAAGGGTLDYWVYSAFFDPLYSEEDPETADHSVGGRLQYGQGVANSWSVGSSFLATEINADWSFLGGVDAEVRWERLLLTSEFMMQQGRIADRDLWDFYVQGVLEVVPTFHLVGRYEHHDPSGRMEDADIGDVGFAWIPKPWIHFKATYRFTDKQTEEVRRGVSASFSLVF
jgi:hypothetical protein